MRVKREKVPRSRYRRAVDRALVGHLRDAIVIIDEGSRIVMATAGIERILGYPPDQLIGRELTHLMPPGLRPRHLAALGDYLHTGRKHLDWGGVELPGLHRDGHEVPLEISFEETTEGNRRLFTGVIRDISARKQAELELEASRREFQQLARRVEHVREEERRRIAREIHDELGQALTALKLDVVWLQERLPAGGEGLVGFADGMQRLIDRTIQQVRRIASELRPGVLDDLGLAAAAEWYAQEFEKHTRIAPEITVRGGERDLDGECATALFRILQEALTNVARHAGARSVQIVLDLGPTEAALDVRDDGRGIRDNEVRGVGSMGLAGMRERAAALGGVVTVERLGERGTAVRARLPLREGTRGGGAA
jgi:PAS domain S-box-containing protein